MEDQTTTPEAGAVSPVNILKKWVEALRSGDYRQGRGMLRKKVTSLEIERYCCLGVACRLFTEVTGQGEWIPSDEHYAFQTESRAPGNTSKVDLPPDVQDVFGAEDPGMSFSIEWARTPEDRQKAHRILRRHNDGGLPGNLITLNDRGASFQEIADIIELLIIPQLERKQDAEFHSATTS